MLCEPLEVPRWPRNSAKCVVGSVSRAESLAHTIRMNSLRLTIRTSAIYAEVGAVTCDHGGRGLHGGGHLTRLPCSLELCRIASSRLPLSLELVADVHRERWADKSLTIRECVEDLVRPMLRHVRRDLLEAGDEAGVADELRADAMIGMAALERRGDHNAWRETSNDAGEPFARGGRVLDAGVRQAEVLADRAPEDTGRLRRFGGALGSRTLRAHLAFREVENRGAMAGLRRLDERPAARELDVVAVRADGEDFHG